jgi:NTP pyrophosphatase (non-canonical NTP hydrolase)
MIEQFWFTPESITALQREMKRAVAKHGVEQTPLVEDDDKSLAILVEEIGEVARAMTYDEGDRKKLAAETLQSAAMALAWYQRLTGERE